MTKVSFVRASGAADNPPSFEPILTVSEAGAPAKTAAKINMYLIESMELG
jgi:hypothetical protein